MLLSVDLSPVYLHCWYLKARLALALDLNVYFLALFKHWKCCLSEIGYEDRDNEADNGNNEDDGDGRQ